MIVSSTPDGNGVVVDSADRAAVVDADYYYVHRESGRKKRMEDHV
jgi:hypothetical protein